MRGVTKDKLPMKILVTLAAVLGLMYVAVAWYVQDLFLYGTRIGMVNASWLTVEETEERFLESLKGYSLEIKARDGQSVQIGSLEASSQIFNNTSWIATLFNSRYGITNITQVADNGLLVGSFYSSIDTPSS